jgi:hypothetical protein
VLLISTLDRENVARHCTNSRSVERCHFAQPWRVPHKDAAACSGCCAAQHGLDLRSTCRASADVLLAPDLVPSHTGPWPGAWQSTGVISQLEHLNLLGTFGLTSHTMHVLPLDRHSASSCTARRRPQHAAAVHGPRHCIQQRQQPNSRNTVVAAATVDASKLLVLASTPQEYFPAAVGFRLFLTSTCTQQQASEPDHSSSSHSSCNLLCCFACSMDVSRNTSICKLMHAFASSGSCVLQLSLHCTSHAPHRFPALLLLLPPCQTAAPPMQDLHATCFDHPRDASAALWARFERIWALQINDDLARRGVGKCVASRARLVTSLGCSAVCMPRVLGLAAVVFYRDAVASPQASSASSHCIAACASRT